MSTEFFNDQWRIPSNENQNKISNYSMDFDGTSAEIDLGTAVVLDTSIAFSFSSWVNLKNYTNYAFPYVAKLKTNEANGWRIMLSQASGYQGITIGNSNTFAKVRTSGDISQDFLNSWNHIVVTYNGSGSNTISNWKIYVNGSSVSLTASSIIGNDANTSFIGSGDGQRFFIGQIDQVSIFDYELSQDQVTQLGAEGYAFNFIPNDRINVGNDSSLNITGDLTISIWVKTTSTAIQGLISKVGSATTRSYALYIYYSSGLSFVQSYVSTDGTTYAFTGKGLTGGISVHDGNWHNIIMVNDPTTTNNYLYVDGVEVMTTTNGRSIFSSTVDTNIGFLDPSYYFNGELSNAQIFNSVIPPTGSNSVQTIYNNGKPLSDMSGFTSLQGWWKLDDTATFNSGTSVWSIPDASTNSNTGASVGMNASNLVASNIDGELISNPMALSPKPIAYYQLGDQSVSTGPTSDYLVPNNSLSDYVFDFDGTDDYLDCGNDSSLSISGDLTISAWVYIDAHKNFNTIVSKISGTDRNYEILFRSTGNVSFYTQTSGGTVDFTTSTTIIPINTWTNIVVTVDSGVTNGTKFYFNGIQDITTGTHTVVGNTANLNIGRRTTNAFYINGKLSNVALWNTNLSSTEITEIFNEGVPNDISSLSPTAWYKLNASEIFNNTSTEWSIDNNAYPSVYNSSLDFNGIPQYLQVPDSNDLSFGNGSTDSPFSISAWINMTDATSFVTIAKDATSNREYVIRTLTDDKLYFYLLDNVNGGYIGRKSNATVTSYQGTWIHTVYTYNGNSSSSGIKIYLNGSPVVISNYQGGLYTAMSNTTTSLNIGRQESGSGTYANGQISNTAIFNTELTSTDVQTLYNNGTPALDISSLNPVSWWKLNNTTTGIQDSAGSNNGTNNGTTEYAGFVNALAGESSGMDSSNLVQSDLQQTSGFSPYALDFSGITANLKTYTIPAATNTVTLSAWVKRTGAAGSYAGVFGARNSGVSPDFGLCWQISFGNNDNKIRFRTSANVSSAWQEVVQNDVMPDDTWHHVAGVADGTNLKIYINGVLQTDTKTQTNGTLQSPTSNIFFAMQGPAGSNPFNGQLSNCARWNIGLTQAEVTEIYNQGVPSNLNNFSGTTPIGWWQLGSNSSFEGNDWTCLDEIGTDYADSGTTAMTNDDIVDGVGYSASGLGTSSIDIKGDAPYSTANGLSENMDVLDRTIDVPG